MLAAVWPAEAGWPHLEFDDPVQLFLGSLKGVSSHQTSSTSSLPINPPSPTSM